jgi:hypothetical protein
MVCQEAANLGAPRSLPKRKPSAAQNNVNPMRDKIRKLRTRSEGIATSSGLLGITAYTVAPRISRHVPMGIHGAPRMPRARATAWPIHSDSAAAPTESARKPV